MKVSQPNQISKSEFDLKSFSTDILKSSPWLIIDKSEREIFNKLANGSLALSTLPAKISRGSSSGDDRIFILKRTSTSQKYITKGGDSVEIEDSLLRIPIYATDFARYKFLPQDEEAIIFPYQSNENGYSLLSETEFKKTYPRGFKYLYSRKKELELRKQFKTWYSFSAPRNLEIHDP